MAVGAEIMPANQISNQEHRPRVSLQNVIFLTHSFITVLWKRRKIYHPTFNRSAVFPYIYWVDINCVHILHANKSSNQLFYQQEFCIFHFISFSTFCANQLFSVACSTSKNFAIRGPRPPHPYLPFPEHDHNDDHGVDHYHDDHHNDDHHMFTIIHLSLHPLAAWTPQCHGGHLWVFNSCHCWC